MAEARRELPSLVSYMYGVKKHRAILTALHAPRTADSTTVMDRSLDEIIGERPQRGSGRAPPSGPRGPRRDGPPMRASRREDYPRDGVRKPRQDRRDDRINLDNDWVHDRFTDDDRYDRRGGGAGRGYDVDRYDDAPRAPGLVGGTRLRVDNVHYDLTEDDLRSLFERKGRLREVRLLYDRMDRSQGTAFVTYEDHRDARDAIDDFDGQNANGQPIRITVMPNGPVGNAPAPPKAGLSLFDRIERPPRSLFDRMDLRDKDRDDGRDEYSGRWRQRSDSPTRNTRPLAEHIDRYMPGRGSRSPIRRRGTPREPGRRPGARREDSGRGARGGRRGGRTDAEGHTLVQGRPRKTAEELDAEMADYWGGGTGAAENGSGAAESNGAAPHAAGDQDEDMVL